MFAVLSDGGVTGDIFTLGIELGVARWVEPTSERDGDGLGISEGCLLALCGVTGSLEVSCS